MKLRVANKILAQLCRHCGRVTLAGCAHSRPNRDRAMRRRHVSVTNLARKARKNARSAGRTDGKVLPWHHF